MAREKSTIQKLGLHLEKVMYQPKKDGVPVVDKDGNPFMKPIFQLPLELLGKKRNFRVTTRTESEMDMVKDFFDLQGEDCDKLPVKIETVEFVDQNTGKHIKRNNVLLKLSEEDNIHVVRLYPLQSETNEFNMAVQENVEGWKCPDKILEVRKKRYEAAKAAREKDIQEPSNEDSKKNQPKKNKKGDDLSF